MVVLAPIGEMLYFVVFLDRESARGIISLRCGNRRAVDHYVKAIEEDQSEDADI